MRGNVVKRVGDFRIFEELDEKGDVVGFTVVSPDGTVSSVFLTLDEAIAHATKLHKVYDAGLTF
ncbi:hypothetical protein [Pseudomonas sp. NPDC089396]|uniref:hypothetical protein n=1 Tax=Pseudomonas sp. NPDC089396 TaxID=3364461 RepID=UPI00383898C5